MGMWQITTPHENVKIVIGSALQQDAVRTPEACRNKLKQVLKALKRIADGEDASEGVTDEVKCRAAVFGVLIAQKVQLTAWADFIKGLDDAENGTVSE